MTDAVAEPELYHLDRDIGEEHNVADAHPDVVARLMERVEEVRQELGDYNRIGRGARFFDEGVKRQEIPELLSRAAADSR
ncbi:MAG: hypothetical protein GY953_19640 [bacterium]|nr:hypothetical protein [bacterium]